MARQRAGHRHGEARLGYPGGIGRSREGRVRQSSIAGLWRWLIPKKPRGLRRVWIVRSLKKARASVRAASGVLFERMKMNERDWYY